MLKSRKAGVTIIAVEPDASPVLSGGKPGPHKIQGTGTGFVPKVLNTEIYDEVIRVTDADAIAANRLYVLPHSAARASIRRRFDRIDRTFEDQAGDGWSH